jgi:Leu/Phe-tRNA-protein transferase
MMQEEFLAVYAAAYQNRNANVLLPLLCNIVYYKSNAMSKFQFVNFLNNVAFKGKNKTLKFNSLKLQILKTYENKTYLQIAFPHLEFFISAEFNKGLAEKIHISHRLSGYEVYKIIYDGTKKYETICKYNFAGETYLFIDDNDNPRQLMDDIVFMGYDLEWCFTYNFKPDFIANLMREGFLIVSKKVYAANGQEKVVLMPQHHILRSVLNFNDLHINRSLKRFLPRYELKFDADFDVIIDKCVAAHSDAWLTKPLIKLIRKIRLNNYPYVKPVSFGVYRDGLLKAGEFGIISGKVYTSYSGYYSENHAGKVQMTLTSKYLQNNGFAFWDLGMPLVYKTELGATNITLPQFLDMFRKANS